MLRRRRLRWDRGRGRRLLRRKLLRVVEVGDLERESDIWLGNKGRHLGEGLGIVDCIVRLVRLLGLLGWEGVHVVALRNRDHCNLGLGLGPGPQLGLKYNGSGSSWHIPGYTEGKNLEGLLWEMWESVAELGRRGRPDVRRRVRTRKDLFGQL